MASPISDVPPRSSTVTAAAAPNTVTLNLGTVRGGTSASRSFQVANTGTGASLRGAVHNAGAASITDTRLSGAGLQAGNFGPVAAGQATVPGIGARKNLELGDEAAYLAAWLWYDAGAYPRAVERLDAFARARPGSPRADDARWFAAWSTLRAGDRRGAQAPQ